MNYFSTYVRVVFATMFWGANFILAGMVMQDVPPLWAAAMRFILAAIMMLIFSLSQSGSLILPLRRSGPAFISVAGIGIVGFNLLFFFAMQSTSPTNGALIMATNPLVTTLIAYLVLSEHPTLRQWLALPLAFVGVMVVITAGNLQHLSSLTFSHGDILMLGANLAWALYNVLSRRYLPAGSALINTTLLMIIGAVILVLIASTSGEHARLPGIHASIALVLMATGGTVMAYLFWMTGITRLGAGRTALFLNLVPVFAMLIASTMGIAPTQAQLIGGFIVILSVSIAVLPTRRRAIAV